MAGVVAIVGRAKLVNQQFLTELLEKEFLLSKMLLG